MLKVCSYTVAIAMAVAATVATPAAAQEIQAGQTEVVGFIGGASDGGGTLFGGGLQFAMSPKILIVPEFGYLTLGDDFSGAGFSVDSHAFEVNGNLHYLFATQNPKVLPYVLGGIGYLRVSASASAGGFSGSASDSRVGVNVGGGLRWQAGDRWGVRPELKIFVADGSNVQFTAGIYYKFGG